MQGNYLNNNPNLCNKNCYPQQGPNAVSINIYSPQAFSSGTNGAATCPNPNNDFYSMYGKNSQPDLPLYPANYNNLMNPEQQQASNSRNAIGETNLLNKTENTEESLSKNNTKTDNKDNKEEQTKKITPLTDDYIKSLENYMNSDNSKTRLIATKEVLERFKEDPNRKDNPSLMPLLNKALKDTSAAIRFVALTALQAGYCVGNDETVAILKQIQSQNKDKVGEDALLASEILLKMSAPEQVDRKLTQEEIKSLEQQKAKDNSSVTEEQSKKETKTETQEKTESNEAQQ